MEGLEEFINEENYEGFIQACIDHDTSESKIKALTKFQSFFKKSLSEVERQIKEEKYIKDLSPEIIGDTLFTLPMGYFQVKTIDFFFS